MSSTKTPEKLTRSDRYQEGKSRNRRVAALALGIAVPVLLVVVGAMVLRSKEDHQVLISPPPTSVAPSPLPGSHQFGEPFTYTSPPGWTFGDSDAGWLRLEMPSSAPGSFYVLRNVRATRPDCSNLLNQNVGASSDAVTKWFSRDPAVDATSPRPITLGAASGSWVDLQLASGRDQTCSNGLSLLSNPEGGESWGIEHNTEKMRFYVVDLPDGNTVTIVVDTRRASDFKQVIRQAAPVVKSFEFSG